MNQSITETTTHFSPAASLAALGVKLKQLDVFGPIRTMVHIKQKTVKHTPTDKLYDALISLLAGAHGLVAHQHALAYRPRLAASLWTHGLRRTIGRARDIERLYRGE
jgi:hypothetical protein